MKIDPQLTISFIAVVISFVLACISFLSYRASIKIQNEIAEKSQAINISTWINDKDFTEDIKYKYAQISNDTSSPIYNVFGIIDSNNNHKTINDFINEKGAIKQQYEYCEILTPGLHKYPFEDYGNSMGNEHQVASLLFTDYNNIEWCRHSNGLLEKKEYIDKLQKRAVLFKHV